MDQPVVALCGGERLPDLVGEQGAVGQARQGVVVGLVMWLINTYIPMAAGIKSILNIVVLIVVTIWLLQGFGIIGNIPGIRIPSLR